MADRDARLREIAGRQKRIVTTRRLRSLGFDSSAVSRRLRDGELTRLYPRVYLVGPGQPTKEGRWLAAVLAAGNGALLSFSRASAVFDVGQPRGNLIDITVAHTRTPRIDGVRLHRTRRLHPDERDLVDGIPITSIERTLLDLASVLPLGDMKRALERAERLELPDWRKLRETVDRARGAAGASVMRDLLGYDPTPVNETREYLERRFYEIVTEAGLPPYSRNSIVEGFEVDAFWREAGLVVELQSHSFHTDRETFICDHYKNAKLQRVGLRVLPVTEHQLRKPSEVVSVLLALIGGR